MSSPQLWARFALSFCALFVAGTIWLGVARPSVLTNSIGRYLIGMNEFNIKEIQGIIHGRSGPATVKVANLDVVYPKRIADNQTGTIYVDYSVAIREQGTDEILVRQSELERDITLTLASSGFEIQPSGDQHGSAGSSLPFTVRWTITPKGEGSRDILLKIDGLRREVRGSLIEATINKMKTVSDSGGWFVLHIDVTNFWGVSNRTASIFSAAIGFCGFLVGYPVVVEIIKRKLGFGSTPST